MKKKAFFARFAMGCLCAVLLIGIFGLVRYMNRSSQQPVTVVQTQYHPANYKQRSSYVSMGIYHQNLYACIYRDGALYVLTPDGFDYQARIEGINYGINDSGIYYSTTTDTGQTMIYLMDISSGERTHLIASDFSVGDYSNNYYYSEKGTLHIAADRGKTVYYAIDGKSVERSNEIGESFHMNGCTYMLEGRLGDYQVVFLDQSGEYHSLEEEIPYGDKSIIPCDQGLLVHNEGQGDLLYLIEKASGEVIELFTVECMDSISAVNVHGDYAYLSFKRYEKHGEIGMLSYENDTLEGTYRISLTDYSVEKISDDIYNGLFIFDDNGIYACNIDTEIYKLDFDGNRIMKIEKH